MTDWSAFRTAVAAAFTQALPTSLRALVAVSWTHGPRAFGDSNGRLLLDEVSHVEEHIREATPDLDEVASSNLITLQVRAESQHDDPTLNALRLIEQVRLGLRKESVTAIFDAAGISLIEIPMAPTRVPASANGRALSAYAFDVTLRAVFTLTPEADDAIGLIEHAEWDATLENPGASDVTYSGEADAP